MVIFIRVIYVNVFVQMPWEPMSHPLDPNTTFIVEPSFGSNGPVPITFLFTEKFNKKHI